MSSDLKPLSLQVDDYLNENISVSQIMEELKPLSKVLEELTPVSSIANDLASLFEDDLEDTLISVLNSIQWTPSIGKMVSDIFENSDNESFKAEISLIINKTSKKDSSSSLNIESLVPVIEKTVEKALDKYIEKNQSPLDKFKRKNIATWLIVILLRYFTWLYGDDFKEANKKFIEKNIIHQLIDKDK